MPEPAGEASGNPFDITFIRQLGRLMRDNELSEVDLNWQGSRLRVRRGFASAVPTMTIGPSPTSGGLIAVNGGGATPPAPIANPAVVPPGKNYVEIKSPIVGTFYAASSPEADPFVKPGSKIRKDSIVCIIEAMKVFNEIPADCEGVIAEVLLESGAPVEYGQVLFRVEPA